MSLHSVQYSVKFSCIGTNKSNVLEFQYHTARIISLLSLKLRHKLMKVNKK